MQRWRWQFKTEQEYISTAVMFKSGLYSFKASCHSHSDAAAFTINMNIKPMVIKLLFLRLVVITQNLQLFFDLYNKIHQ